MPPIRRAFARAMACAFVLAAAPAGAQSLSSGKVNTGTPSFVNDQNVPLQLDAAGNLKTAASPSDATSSAAGGVTVYRVMSTADTNARTVKASGGRLYTYTICNAASAARYVRFFNLATMPVAGTSPVYLGAVVISAGTCQSYSNGVGLAFPAGIGFDITAANGDADTTAVAAGDVSGFIGYR